jgi:hypothetical protein
VNENEQLVQLRPSLLAPDQLVTIQKKQIKSKATSAIFTYARRNAFHLGPASHS